MPRNYDIAIVGGGLVGSTLACALAASTHRIALIERNPVSTKNGTGRDQDERNIALTCASKMIFEALGVWEQLDEYSVPIEKIHISDQGRFGAMRVDCRNHEADSLGYLVPAERLTQAIQSHVRHHKHVKRIQPYRVSNIQSHEDKVTLYGEGAPIEAKLLIAADGTHSFIRNALGIPVEKKPYCQTAIIGNIGVTDHHPYTAFVRFTEQGPLVLLPRADNCYGFVWTLEDGVAQEHMALSEYEFLRRLQSAFGHRLGYFARPCKRFSYPLSLQVSQRLVQQRTVLVGNAAQTLHPVAAQGLNLALRDIAELCEILYASQDALDGVNDKLRVYESRRQPDIEGTVHLTDRLNYLFTTNNPVLARVRGVGLALLGAIPVLEQRIMQQSSGASGSTARLLQGKALQTS